MVRKLEIVMDYLIKRLNEEQCHSFPRDVGHLGHLIKYMNEAIELQKGE
jgi:hypothetical protein